jgi:hypothetical protein
VSAYIVDKAHVDALVRAAEMRRVSYWRADPARPTGGDRIPVTRENRDAIGQLLTDANVESVSHRYQDDSLTELPGRTDAWWLIPYRYSARGPILEPVAGLKACDGYEYQSCEHPGWPTSEAHALIEALRSTLIHALPGYGNASWTIDEEAADAAPFMPSLLDIAAASEAELRSWHAFRDANIPGGE